MMRRLIAAALVAATTTNSLDVAGACSRARRSKDAIVWLRQRKHSTYDATHANTLNASMASVARFYPAFVNADVLVWHEGDLLERRDADALARVPGANVRWCLLSERTGWGPRADQRGAVAKDPRWAPGYLYMIRWYAVTCWDVSFAPVRMARARYDRLLALTGGGGGAARSRRRGRICERPPMDSLPPVTVCNGW